MEPLHHSILTGIRRTAARPTDSQALDGTTVAVQSGKSPLTYGANPSLQIAAVVLLGSIAISTADYSRYLFHSVARKSREKRNLAEKDPSFAARKQIFIVQYYWTYANMRR